jgi:hypothetical protein
VTELFYVTARMVEESSGGKSGHPRNLYICNRFITKGGLKLIGNVPQNILLTVGTLHLLFVSKKRQDEKEKIDTTIYRFTCFIHKMYADMD